MPPKRKKYKVVKVALGYEPPFQSPNFEPTTTLFMELLENKSKIKEEVRDLEWRSKYQSADKPIPRIEEMYQQTKDDMEREIEESQDGYVKQETTPAVPSVFSKSGESPSVSPRSENRFISRFLEVKGDSGAESKDLAGPEKDHDDESYTSGMFKSLVRPRLGSPKVEGENIPSKGMSNSFLLDPEEESISKYRSSHRSASPSKEDSLSRLMRGEISDEENGGGKESKYTASMTTSIQGSEKSSLTVPVSVGVAAGATSAMSFATSSVSSAPSSAPRPIPSLEAIIKNQVPAGYSSSNGVKGAEPNIVNMSYIGTEKDLYRKREILDKLQRLRREYTDGNIPEVNEYMDIRDLEREYDIAKRRLTLDSKLANYKRFLTIGFVGLEFVLKTFLKFEDIEGFARDQKNSMPDYERLLREIGEKHQVEPSQQWPPELRLVGLVFMNAVIFIGTKMLLKATGDKVMSMLSSPGPAAPSTSGGKPSSVPSRSPEPVNKRKMRGPDIDIEDLDEGKKLN